MWTTCASRRGTAFHIVALACLDLVFSVEPYLNILPLLRQIQAKQKPNNSSTRVKKGRLTPKMECRRIADLLHMVPEAPDRSR